MKTFQLIATGIALIAVGGCADGRDVLGPNGPAVGARGQASEAATPGARQVDASGTFAAQIDPTTFTFTPRGRNCLLTVGGRLIFSGTIVGTATGTTTALVFAPCSEVMANPPGTFRDVFKSELRFEGTVDGEPAEADLLYMGRVEAPSGEIEGRLVFSNGVAGRLEADAVVAVGGTYRGKVVVR
jgi:hypothetical protein